MVKSRSAAQAAQKWKERASIAGPDYEAGVRNPKKSWSGAAIAQEGAYEQGVQAGIARKAFGKGVRETGDEGWSKGAIEKGVARFGPGVALAEEKYNSEMGKVISTIERTSLPARGPRGDPRNMERSNKLAAALHKMRTGGGSASAAK